MSLLDASLRADYPGKPGVLDDFRLAIERKEICGLVGESGSGKSTFAKALLGLGRARLTGTLRFDGHDLLALKEREYRCLRGRVLSYVPQSPLAALNPYRRIESHFREAWVVHEPHRARDWRDASLAALRAARSEDVLRLHPGQLSTGMCLDFATCYRNIGSKLARDNH